MRWPTNWSLRLKAFRATCWTAPDAWPRPTHSALLAIALLTASPGAIAQPEAEALRIASLAPSLTELVCALGLQDHLVGRSSACDYPPGVEAVAVVGGFGRPNLEALLRVRPTLVLYAEAENPAALGPLEAAGAKVLHLSCHTWADMQAAARSLGAAAGRPERAEAWIAAAQERRELLMARARRAAWPDGPPSIFVEVWSDPLTTAGAESHLNEVLALAGGVNLAAGLHGAYPHVSAEWVVSRRPDVILIARMTPAGDAARELPRRPGWHAIPAVRDGRIIDDVSPDMLLRPGPRWLEGAEEIARRLEAWRPAAAERAVP